MVLSFKVFLQTFCSFSREIVQTINPVDLLYLQLCTKPNFNHRFNMHSLCSFEASLHLTIFILGCPMNHLSVAIYIIYNYIQNQSNHRLNMHSLVPSFRAFLRTFFHSAILGTQFRLGFPSIQFPRNRYSPDPDLVPHLNGRCRMTFPGFCRAESEEFVCSEKSVKVCTELVRCIRDTRTVSSVV